jgi:uncharacterized damage-inducible protein DinB
MKCILSIMLAATFSTALHAQSNPLSDEIRGGWTAIMRNILQSADKMPEQDYNFKPMGELRTFGELIGHVADFNYIFCGFVKGESNKPDNQENRHTKAELLAAIRRSTAYCDSSYHDLTDANGTQMMKMFGGLRTRMGILSLNVTHDNETYGSIAVYLRLKGLVPPSSEGR